MAYYSRSSLEKMGFKFLGENVKISDKASIYDPELIEIGDNSRIDDFCVLSGKIKIGIHVHVAPFCLVAGGEEGVFMDDFSGLAYKVQVFTQSDDYSGETLTNPTIPARFKKEYKKSISIGRHVIVGAGSIVMPGVCLAEGCSIGAMALIHKDTSPWGIYTGCPAKRIKSRKKDLLTLEKKFLDEQENDSI
ncbi:acyltransferase [Neptunomonas phycophila]|uniref:acyltransferase n=1 Tax=Neptunomonas phycophila TaxID=1572645 RepID=UPI0037366355